ncbi:ABC transporter ATP-binding protein [Ruminococcus turbiniformis]
MEAILEIQHMSVSFTQYGRGIRRRQLPVIRDLSLSVGPGEVVAVVGASGSGKSLLAHGILGILPYNSCMEGKIYYDGQVLTRERAGKLRKGEIALIPQGVTYLDPLMKVRDQLTGGKRDKETLDRCRRALERYGLGKETEELYPFELSGGMARRVLIASAVMQNPRLIIADEPTPGLDVRAAKRILGHFRELADEGAGMLFITHDLALALEVADRVTVFYAGETIEEASVSDFAGAERLRHPFTKALWRAMPGNGFVPLRGAQPYPGTVRQGCPFAEQCERCRRECTETEQIPLRLSGGGKVRCLYPEEGDCTALGAEIGKAEAEDNSAGHAGREIAR